MAGAREPGSALTVCLHGLGGDAASFRSALGSWVPSDAVFLDGPQTDVLTSRRRWFPFTARPEALERHLDTSATDLEARIALARATRRLPADAPVDLVGHSQGAVLALEVVRAGRVPVHRATAFAGFLPPGRLALPPVPRERTASVDVYGSTRDRFVSIGSVSSTARALAALPGMTIRCFVSDTIDHAFGPDWLDATRFHEEVTHVAPAAPR